MLKERENATYILEERQKYAKDYLRMLEDMVDGHQAPNSSEMSSLINEDKQYFTAIFDSVFISYVCRHKDCGYYGSNSDWVKQANRYKLRCPRCARLCRPFADSQGASSLHPFQKVLAVIDPITQRIFALPTTWPDTASDEFPCNMAVTQARKIMSEGNAEAESRFKSNADECLRNLLQKVGLPPSMQHYQGILPEARHIFESAAGFGAEAIAHLASSGYRGAILPTEVSE